MCTDAHALVDQGGLMCAVVFVLIIYMYMYMTYMMYMYQCTGGSGREQKENCSRYDY